MKTVALICPNASDAVQLARAGERWAPRYAVVPYGHDAEDDPAAFDALRFIDEAVSHFRRHPVDGVTSSSDYPGILVAAAIARELGLPGPDPAVVLRCAHKYYARLAQREAVPEATPPFARLDPARLDPDGCPLPLPCFVKPVKSWFSVFARLVDHPSELRAFVADAGLRAHLSAFVRPFNQLLTRYTDLELDGRYLLAEGLLQGTQVTVEGYVSRGRVAIIGVVDSVMFPGTISFQRFDYPSALEPRVQGRMAELAARLVRHLGLDDALFNVELFYAPETDAITIIEINPRMCGQFADLYEQVNGVNTYEILFALAAGEPPPPARAGNGRYGVAASFPLRSFTDAVVRRVPDTATIAAVGREYPVTLVKAYYGPGQRLSAGNQGDGQSYRYGLVNMAAPDRQSLLAMFDEVQRRLGFELGDA